MNWSNCNMRNALVIRIVFAVGGAVSCLWCFLCLSGCEHPVRDLSPEESCQRHLEYLGKGMAGYRNAHGDLPQVLEGPNGDKHSWRILVASYVSPDKPFVDYRLDRPWDSVHNRRQLAPLLYIFFSRCRLDPSPAGYPFFTSYLMLVRPPVRDSETGEMKAPPLATDAVLVVESVDCGVAFAEPRDLPWEDLWKGDSPFGKGKLNSRHRNVVMALRVDGKVIEIPKNITKEDLKKLLAGTETK
jgi:hypothetical protein